MIGLEALVAVCGLVLSVATFFIGRVSNAKNEGSSEAARLVKMEKDIEYMRKDLEGIGRKIDQFIRKTDDSFHRAHERIDELYEILAEHVRVYHKQ